METCLVCVTESLADGVVVIDVDCVRRLVDEGEIEVEREFVTSDVGLRLGDVVVLWVDEEESDFACECESECDSVVDHSCEFVCVCDSEEEDVTVMLGDLDNEAAKEGVRDREAVRLLDCERVSATVLVADAVMWIDSVAVAVRVSLGVCDKEKDSAIVLEGDCVRVNVDEMEGLEVVESERVLVKLADSDCELVVDGTIEELRDIERLGDLIRVKLLEALTVVETDCESVCETDLLVVVVVEPEMIQTAKDLFLCLFFGCTRRVGSGCGLAERDRRLIELIPLHDDTTVH